MTDTIRLQHIKIAYNDQFWRDMGALIRKLPADAKYVTDFTKSHEIAIRPTATTFIDGEMYALVLGFNANHTKMYTAHLFFNHGSQFYELSGNPTPTDYNPGPYHTLEMAQP